MDVVRFKKVTGYTTFASYFKIVTIKNLYFTCFLNNNGDFYPKIEFIVKINLAVYLKPNKCQ